MDSRLRFLHYRDTEKMQGTQEWKISEEEEKLVSKDIVKKISNELSRITLTRKAHRNCLNIPVPQTDTGR